MTQPEFGIAGRPIGPEHPVYVIAELSGNHHQDIDVARELVRAAADAGADAVKLQTYTADTITLDMRTPPFHITTGTVWDGAVLHDLYRDAYTPWEWHAELMELATELGLTCFSSPFDPTAVAFLETLHVPAYKIASFELVDLPLLRIVASMGKPMIMSTGMATEDEISEAVETVRAVGPVPVALLRASSAYPAPASDMNLRSINYLSETFDVVSGLSDHTLGIAVPVAAVAMGARIIEKHLTLSRDDPGPDTAFSLEPDEFDAMVQAVRTADEAMGDVYLGPTEHEQASLPFRRSLFVVEDIAAGDPLTEQNVRSIRPSDGMHTRHLPDVLGRHARQDIPKGTPLSPDLFE